MDIDNRDKLIAQLREEIQDLKANERDFNEISMQLRNLEHRYAMMTEEKIRAESEFRGRLDSNFLTVANLKTEIDSLRESNLLKGKEIQDLHQENDELQQITRNSAEVIESMKKELDRVHEELSFFREKAGEKYESRFREELYDSRLREDKFGLDKTVTKFPNSIDSDSNGRLAEYESVIYDLEKRLGESDREKAALIERLGKTEAELNELNRGEALMEVELENARKEMTKILEQIRELSEQKDKYKRESNEYRRRLAEEKSKSDELREKVKSLEKFKIFREIEDKTAEYRRMREAYIEGIELSDKLRDDLNRERGVNKALVEKNEELVKLLKSLSDEDCKIRDLLDRRDAIREVISRNEYQRSPIFSYLVSENFFKNSRNIRASSLKRLRGLLD